MLDGIGLGNGQTHAQGPVAAELLRSGFNVNALRPCTNPSDMARLRANAVLRKEEWAQFDTKVVDIARSRLKLVGFLIERGLVTSLENGMGTTVLQWETQSDLEAAEVSMDGVSRAKASRLEFTQQQIPIPIIHNDFYLNTRVVEASRRLGQPLDVAQAGVAARKVAEQVDSVVVSGASITFGGGTLYGLLNHPNRNTGNFETTGDDWDAAGKTGAQVLADVQSMVADARTDKMYGPFALLVPSGYEGKLDDDYKAESDVTIRQRILQLDSVVSIQVIDSLTAHNVVLVQLTSDVVEIVIGQQVTTVQWEEEGGFRVVFKVLSIMVPRVRADYAGKSGVIHYVNTP